jgi:predicted nucleic acid-binding protein
LLKWVLPEEREPHVAEALEIRDAFVAGRIRLLVPALWLFEAGNMLGLCHPDTAVERLSALMDAGIPEAEVDREWKCVTLNLMNKHRVTFYDASYHALAIVNRGVFVTADARYLRKVGSASSLRLLSEWRAR